MQTLIWHPTWERTISALDREELTACFREGKGQRFIPFRTTENHRGDFLVTVIIQNLTSRAEIWDNKKLSYYVNGERTAFYQFEHIGFTLPAYSSMAWTFIFPRETMTKRVHTFGKLVEE